MWALTSSVPPGRWIFPVIRCVAKCRGEPASSPCLNQNSINDLMNATHLHLLLNHVPVLGTVIGLGLFAFASWRRSEDIKRAALGLFVMAALVAIPTYLTGEPAEDSVESLPGVSHPLVERHEDAAAVALTGVLVLGVLALVGLIWFRRQRPVPAWFGICTLLAALIVSGLMGWTANLGGQVRHTEIRAASTSALASHGDSRNP